MLPALVLREVAHHGNYSAPRLHRRALLLLLLACGRTHSLTQRTENRPQRWLAVYSHGEGGSLARHLGMVAMASFSGKCIFRHYSWAVVDGVSVQTPRQTPIVQGHPRQWGRIGLQLAKC